VRVGFLLGSLKERDHLEELGVDGITILRWPFRKWCRGMNWTELAHDGDRWKALMNAVMNLRFQYNAGDFLIS
jgi:hypothetical protein